MSERRAAKISDRRHKRMLPASLLPHAPFRRPPRYKPGVLSHDPQVKAKLAQQLAEILSRWEPKLR